MVSGPNVAVNAIVAGHTAAVSIDRFLNGGDTAEGHEDISPPQFSVRLVPVPKGQHKYEPVVPMPVLSIEERIRGFEEVEQGYAEEQAIQEAKRCLQCIGSRDISCRNRYCSSVCCMYAIKEAVIAKEHMGNVDVTVFFMDMRAVFD